MPPRALGQRPSRHASRLSLASVVLAESPSVQVRLTLDEKLAEGLWLRLVVADRDADRGPLHHPWLEAGAEDSVPLHADSGRAVTEQPVAAREPPAGRNRLLTSRELAEAGTPRLTRDALPPELLRYGVVFPGGWAATNLGMLLFPDDYVLAFAPLLDVVPAGGPSDGHEERLWLSPPPTGNTHWVVEWPGEGIAETWTGVAW